MTEQPPTNAPGSHAADPTQVVPTPAPPPAPVGAGQLQAQPGSGQVGNIRGTGMCILLAIVTLGIYTWVWYFKTHDEMKRHTGDGLGGGLALVLAIFLGIVMPFLTASEAGNMYKRAGQQPPVSGVTGLWVLLPLVGALVWFIKTNGALNAYWRTQGVV
jgi:hypothetical protein